MATNPNGKKGDPNSLVFMKGTGIDILATLCASFKADGTLKGLVREALLMSAIMPNSVIQKSEKPQ